MADTGYQTGIIVRFPRPNGEGEVVLTRHHRGVNAIEYATYVTDKDGNRFHGHYFTGGVAGRSVLDAHLDAVKDYHRRVEAAWLGYEDAAK